MSNSYSILKNGLSLLDENIKVPDDDMKYTFSNITDKFVNMFPSVTSFAFLDENYDEIYEGLSGEHILVLEDSMNKFVNLEKLKNYFPNNDRYQKFDFFIEVGKMLSSELEYFMKEFKDLDADQDKIEDILKTYIDDDNIDYNDIEKFTNSMSDLMSDFLM